MHLNLLKKKKKKKMIQKNSRFYFITTSDFIGNKTTDKITRVKNVNTE